jgi:hypothetical protein
MAGTTLRLAHKNVEAHAGLQQTHLLYGFISSSKGALEFIEAV